MTDGIGLLYGSTGGATARVAWLMAAMFHERYNVTVETLDIADYYLDEALEFDRLIFGIPTWNVGQLQKDWEDVIDELYELDLSGKTAAVFGLGDQIGYPRTFGDALFFLADRLEARGARLVGAWPLDSYTFEASWAVRDGHFLGLMLDEDNQAELTPERVAAWVDQLAREFGLMAAEPPTHG
jgi:flavodoxin long chain